MLILLANILPIVLIVLKFVINYTSNTTKMLDTIEVLRVILVGISTIFNFTLNDKIINNWIPWVKTPPFELYPYVTFKRRKIKQPKTESPQLINNEKKATVVPIAEQRRISYIESQVRGFQILDAGKIVMPTQKLLHSTDMEKSETILDNLIVADVNNYYNARSEDHTSKNSNEIKNADNLKEVVKELNRLADLDFNVFNLHNNSEGFELLVLMSHLWRIGNYQSKIGGDSEAFSSYFYHANIRYKKNPYHNSTHAADVTQTFFFLTKTCNIELISNLTELDMFSCLFAAAIHDLEHPGNTNSFEIATRSEIALSYNDKAVLENYHLFKAFHLLRKEELNFTSSFSKKTFIRFRSLVIQCVLATDMEVHASELNNLKAKATSEEFDPAGKDKDFLLSQLIHAADISNPIKPFDIYRKWVDCVLEEFFVQGDKEKSLGLPVSFLCDRNTTKVPDSQLGFIRFVVSPLFQGLALAYPNMKMVVNLIKCNEEEFVKMKELEGEQKK